MNMHVARNIRMGYVMAEGKAMIEKARRLATYCSVHGFEGAGILKGMKVGQLTALYDGIGPNWSSQVLAGIVEHISYDFEPAAFLLDIQYRIETDRSEESFHRCNAQFLANCMKCIKEKYPWWRFLKRRSLAKSARILYRACEDHGSLSWENRGLPK